MARAIKHKDRRAVLLSRIPEGTKRVQVKTDTGKICFKALDDLAKTDEIQTKKDGTPIVMKKEPGRNRDVVLTPTTPTVDALLKRKDAAIKADPILQAIINDPESTDVLHVIMLALAEEQASIRAERVEAERNGKETSSFSVRRLNALRAVVDTWLRRKDQTASKDLDFKSPGFRAVFRYIMETFKEALDSCGVTPGMAQTVMARSGKMFDDDWEKEAKNRAKRAV